MPSHKLRPVQKSVPGLLIQVEMFVKIQVTQPAYIVGPQSARQRNAIQMAIRLRADGGPLSDAYGGV